METGEGGERGVGQEVEDVVRHKRRWCGATKTGRHKEGGRDHR